MSEKELNKTEGLGSDPDDTLALQRNTAHPKHIGPFKILDVLGEGGMGVVYHAEQETPVRRRLALKLIKPGMDSRAVIARFESERQALALMDHPCIAKVYDAGTSELGLPYFVMELVQGMHITDYCDKNQLPLAPRIEIFLHVCRAVQHAHQKGIIHRDLKPSNVLVHRRDGEARPKVIDFGLAKATGRSLTDKTLHTKHGILVGSPHYMSPEQANPLGIDTDTRTDVYSLGVLLYELLVGQRPFDVRDAIRRGDFEEIKRTICEFDPLRPSLRIKTDHDAESSKRRGMEPGSHRRKLSGDLDWIVTKALEKDRTRRYATVNGLAADLRRYLNHEPVTAGPPSTFYRLKKMARKHGTTALALVISLLALLVGVTASTFLYFRAEAARKTAEEKQEETDRALDQVKLSKELAESRLLEYERLADIRRLKEAHLWEGTIWPAHPDKVAEIERWLLQAQALLNRFDEHKKALATLRESGRKEEDQWIFEKSTDQWRHDALAELVSGLTTFVNPDPSSGTIAGMRERLQWARTLGARSIQTKRTRWNEAIASIGDPSLSPRYSGLSLRPQMGLVPIGQDPVSGLWEFSLIATGESPERDSNNSIVFTDSTAIVFVLIPGGSFFLGATEETDPMAQEDEAPVRRIEIAPFFLSKYEMTLGQWERFTGKNPGVDLADHQENWPPLSLTLPAHHISWSDADTILTRLGLILPTEAQWEYAARAGTTSVWYAGNEPSCLAGQANLADRSAALAGKSWMTLRGVEFEDGSPLHSSVGSFAPNPFGLHDIHGNVWEWCRDTLESYELPVMNHDGYRKTPGSSRRADGKEAPLDPLLKRVNRGGSFDGSPSDARSANRRGNRAQYRSSRVGVRPARMIDP